MYDVALLVLPQFDKLDDVIPLPLIHIQDISQYAEIYKSGHGYTDSIEEDNLFEGHSTEWSWAKSRGYDVLKVQPGVIALRGD